MKKTSLLDMPYIPEVLLLGIGIYLLSSSKVPHWIQLLVGTVGLVLIGFKYLPKIFKIILKK